MRLNEIFSNNQTNTFHTFLYLYDDQVGEFEPDVIVHYDDDPDDPDVGYRGAGVEITGVEFAEDFEIGGKRYQKGGFLEDHPELKQFVNPNQEEQYRIDILDQKEAEAEGPY